MASVQIYMKSTCSFCYRALALLNSKGVEPEQIFVDAGGPKKAEMVQRANGRTTVPQIFIDGQHVGGCDDLYVLDRVGKLDPMLGAGA